MIQAVFKRQMFNLRLNRFEPCQVIVHFENEQYHANILSLDVESGRSNYIQQDTPFFQTQNELKAHIRRLLENT